MCQSQLWNKEVSSMSNQNTVDREGVIASLALLPADAIIDEVGLSRIFNRHPVSIKRAIRRGEIPPGVRLLGKQTWTARVVLDHLSRRLDAARQESERLQRRISALTP
jgi:hypothetical protein